MEEALEYLPEEYFEVKNSSLYYHPPENAEEFLKHYELFWPVRMWVQGELDIQEYEVNSYSIRGVWASSSSTVKFVSSDFDEVIF